MGVWAERVISVEEEEKERGRRAAPNRVSFPFTLFYRFDAKPDTEQIRKYKNGSYFCVRKVHTSTLVETPKSTNSQWREQDFVLSGIIQASSSRTSRP